MAANKPLPLTQDQSQRLAALVDGMFAHLVTVTAPNTIGDVDPGQLRYEIALAAYRWACAQMEDLAA